MKDALTTIANTIRGLSMDAVQAANSGHPGLPLGCADLAAVLFTQVLRHSPQHPQWINRDRFVLSAGHGSMLLYSLLHLSGYKVSLDELKRFRQYGAHTAGHPEFGDLPGVETTTGPLGQGFATGVGMALGQKIVAEQYGLGDLLHSKVFILCGDGCMMEGISSEAASFAGHLGLDNVVVIYDANDICLDGPISECFSEDVGARFKAQGWDVLHLDGHNFDNISATFAKLKTQTRPTLLIAKTIIGKGSPTYQGSCEVHGKALGPDEVLKTKENLGIPTTPDFYVPDAVLETFATLRTQQETAYAEWQGKFNAWEAQNPEKAARFKASQTKTLPADFEAQLAAIEIPTNAATRQASGMILQRLYELVPYLVGGSADLSGSDNTMMKKGGLISAGHFNARNIKFGVREFAMGAIASGLALQGNLLPFCGTFLTFSDYMRNAIRLAALMKLPVIYQFTHDSIFLGEDGPTHQPIEHVASLRAMPGLTVVRPADANEVKGAWMHALKSHTPTALILSRQNLPILPQTRIDGVARGAYILLRESQPTIDYALFATGSEVPLALQVAEALIQKGKSVRVISIPSFEIFEQQDPTYRETVLGGNIAKRVSIEALTSFGWHKYIGSDGISISVDTFGMSAPAKDLAIHFGFTVEKILGKL